VTVEAEDRRKKKEERVPAVERLCGVRSYRRGRGNKRTLSALHANWNWIGKEKKKREKGGKKVHPSNYIHFSAARSAEPGGGGKTKVSGSVLLSYGFASSEKKGKEGRGQGRGEKGSVWAHDARSRSLWLSGEGGREGRKGDEKMIISGPSGRRSHRSSEKKGRKKKKGEKGEKENRSGYYLAGLLALCGIGRGGKKESHDI